MASWFTRDQPPFPLTLPIKIRNIEIDGGVVRVRRRYRGDWERPFVWFSCILVTETEFLLTGSSYAVKLLGPGRQLANFWKGQNVSLYQNMSGNEMDLFTKELSRLMNLPIRHEMSPDGGDA